MSKKSGGLFTLLTGVAAGAAAVFFAKKENRVKAQKLAKQASRSAAKLKAEYKKNPQATKTKLKKQALKTAKKALQPQRKRKKTKK